MHIIAPVLSLLPRRWRELLPRNSSMPWVPPTIISGLLQAVCGLAALEYWYSYSVTGWAQKSLITASDAHPGAAIPIGTEGFVGLLLVAAHPLTWVIVAFSLEGLVRVCAAAFTGEILGTFPLFIVDKIFGLVIHRDSAAPDSGNLPSSGGPSIFQALRQKYLVARYHGFRTNCVTPAAIPNNLL